MIKVIKVISQSDSDTQPCCCQWTCWSSPEECTFKENFSLQVLLCLFNLKLSWRKNCAWKFSGCVNSNLHYRVSLTTYKGAHAFDVCYPFLIGFPDESMVKNICQCRRHGFDPRVRKIQLKKEMATHSNILAWKIPWTEEPGRLQSMSHKESDMTELLNTHTHASLSNKLLCMQWILDKLW